jgi:hypothetical protein
MCVIFCCIVIINNVLLSTVPNTWLWLAQRLGRASSHSTPNSIIPIEPRNTHYCDIITISYVCKCTCQETVCLTPCSCASQFLGAFAKLWNSNVNFVMSVRPHGKTRLPLDGFSWNLVSEYFKKKICWEVQLKPDKNKEYFVWRPVYLYHNIPLSSP